MPAGFMPKSLLLFVNWCSDLPANILLTYMASRLSGLTLLSCPQFTDIQTARCNEEVYHFLAWIQECHDNISRLAYLCAVFERISFGLNNTCILFPSFIHIV